MSMLYALWFPDSTRLRPGTRHFATRDCRTVSGRCCTAVLDRQPCPEATRAGHQSPREQWRGDSHSQGSRRWSPVARARVSSHPAAGMGARCERFRSGCCTPSPRPARCSRSRRADPREDATEEADSRSPAAAQTRRSSGYRGPSWLPQRRQSPEPAWSHTRFVAGSQGCAVGLLTLERGDLTDGLRTPSVLAHPRS